MSYHHIQNKKLLLRLSAETLKFHTLFDAILQDKECRPLIDEPCMYADMGFTYVCMYEFFCGRGTKELPREVNDTLSHFGPILRRRERELSEEGRGLQSIREKNDKREKDVLLPRYARINILKWTEEEAYKALEDEEWTVVRLSEGESFIDRIRRMKNDEVLVDPHVPLLLAFPAVPNFHTYWMITNRNLILQDKASCLPAFLLNPDPNSSIIDACAAPGMKTSHLAAMINNTGTIFAFDRSYERTETMKEMLGAASVRNAKVLNEDFLKINVKSGQYANVEYALVDPPCSGSGIVKRMDEWLGGGVDECRLSKLANLQAMLLKHAMSMPSLRRVVYSTCSVHDTENEMVVAEVLKDVSTFRVKEGVLPEWTERGKEAYDFGQHCLRADPSKTATNGFFVAVFERIEGEMRDEKMKKKDKRMKKENMSSKWEEEPKKRKLTEEEEEEMEEMEKKKKKIEERKNGNKRVFESDEEESESEIEIELDDEDENEEEEEEEEMKEKKETKKMMKKVKKNKNKNKKNKAKK